MYTLSGKDEKLAKDYIDIASKIAKKATCKRSKCGSIIVKNGEVIAEGYNSPPLNLPNQCRCENSKDVYHQKVTDKTCCIHAEQRAIMDGLAKDPNNLKGSRLYFIRLGEGDKIEFAGKPYCTICSKMSLDVGVSEFVLYHKDGIVVYPTQEYNDLSYKYFEEK